MDDLISRKAAIDALKQQAETMSEWSNRYAEQKKGVLTAVNIVEDLPFAQRWIPCSERLPEEEGRYLVSFPPFFGERYYIDIESFAHDLESVDKYDFEGRKRSGWYDYDDEYGYLERDDVVAWMPLPEAYEPPKEDKL